MNKSKIFDTGSYTHLAAENLLAQPETPCAVAGPFHDIPMAELSTLAASLKFPVTAHRSFSIYATSNTTSPYTSQVFPDVITDASVLANYLLFKGRTEYVALVYTLTRIGTERRETISIVMDEAGITNLAFAYNSIASPATSNQRTIRKTLEAVRDSGYRTIVVAPELPTEEIPVLAATANELGLTNGDYVWVWFGDYDPFFGDSDSTIREFLEGSIWIVPLEGYHTDVEDSFYKAWMTQGPREVERLNRENPIDPGAPGYLKAEDDYFQTREPEYGSSFMYDAIIATGLGACLAMTSLDEESGQVPIESFVQGIRSVDFHGATGEIRFCLEDCALRGTRDPYTTVWGVLNNYPPGTGIEPWQMTEMIIGKDVIHFNDTIYQNGLTTPPALRDLPEQNYLSNGVQIFGFVLVGIAVLTAIVAALCVYTHREHRIVKAAQPYFLYILCFGSVLTALSIIPASFDESDGFSQDRLSRACMAFPWLAFVGFTLTYGALLTKLWRVNRVLQFARRKIDIKHVAWPMAILVGCAVLVLSLWTALDPLQWERKEIDSVTGESVGLCSCDGAARFAAPLYAIMLIPTVSTLFMAWKTKDVDDMYSESRWIFAMIVVQLQVLLFSIPIIVVLSDSSTDGRYIGQSLLIWSIPMSTLCLIIGPKVVAYYRTVHDSSRHLRGASHGKVHVSGLRLAEQHSSRPTSSQKSRGSLEQLVKDPRESASHEPTDAVTLSGVSGKHGVPGIDIDAFHS